MKMEYFYKGASVTLTSCFERDRAPWRQNMFLLSRTRSIKLTGTSLINNISVIAEINLLVKTFSKNIG